VLPGLTSAGISGPVSIVGCLLLAALAVVILVYAADQQGPAAPGGPATP
jgi:hypothetical protein